MATKTNKIVNAFSTMFNPLRNMTQSSVNYMIDQLKYGNDVRIQVAFEQMEKSTPLFGICIQKRLAGITGREWDVVPLDESSEAKNQAETIKAILQKADTRNVDGLTEALKSLGSAAFRGRAVVKPFFDDNGDLYFIRVPNANTLEWNNHLYWNPDANQAINFMNGVPAELQELDENEVCWIKEERPVDIPGLQVYLRQLVGEENWARFVEKEGVPQVVITAPDGTPDNVLDKWNQRAIAIFEGGSGVLPSGAKVDQLVAARGQDPFSAFIEHQSKMVCILATGSTGCILGDVGGGLGSDLVTKQDEQFQSLVNMDCKRISNTMTRCTLNKIAKKLGQELKCRFTFIEDDYVEPKEYLEMAKMCSELGLSIDIEQLKKVTGLTFIGKEEKDLWTPKREESES